MVDKLSLGIIGGDWHLYINRRQCGYICRFSYRLGAVATWIGWGAEYEEEGIDDHEGWRVFQYYETARGGQSVKINRERTADHDINADREGFAYCSACPFLAPFSSVLYTPELGCRLKTNNPGNRQYVFLRRFFTPSTSRI